MIDVGTTEDPMLTSVEAAEYLGLTRATLSQLRFQGVGPAYYKPTERIVFYRKSDLDAWFEASRHEPGDKKKSQQVPAAGNEIN